MRRMGLARAGGVVAVAGLALAGCSAGGTDDGTVEIEWLVQVDAPTVAMAEAMVAAFEEEHPDISVTLQTQPNGAEGDNLTRTKLSTGEMSDVFFYNSGSLFEALQPDNTLVDLSDQPWVDDLSDDYRSVVSTDDGVYGAPLGASSAGGVVYNTKVYESLGLEVPESWDEFMANSRAIADAGTSVPIVQTYGDDWSAQLFVLADFGNVAAADPDWADGYTANERKYEEEPALAGFRHQQEAFEAGLFNDDYQSLLYDEAVGMLADGTAAQYPMLSSAISPIRQNFPDRAEDIGFFAMPADDPELTTLTMWQPNALYIPLTTEGEELEAAKELVAFINTPPGCAVQASTGTPSGPYVISSCPAPDDVPRVVTDIQAYVDADRTSPALEFLSPVKGPNLPNITIEVGSGISTAERGAATYDQDVEKQAQQLNLPGW